MSEAQKLNPIAFAQTLKRFRGPSVLFALVANKANIADNKVMDGLNRFRSALGEAFPGGEVRSVSVKGNARTGAEKALIADVSVALVARAACAIADARERGIEMTEFVPSLLLSNAVRRLCGEKVIE